MSRRARNCAYLRLTEEEKELARQSSLLNPLVYDGVPAVLPERRSASSSADEGLSSSPSAVHSAVPSAVPSLGKKGGKDAKGKDTQGKPPKFGEKKKKGVSYFIFLLLYFLLFSS